MDLKKYCRQLIFLRLLIPVIMGIVAAQYLQVSSAVLLICISISILIAINFPRSFTYRWVPGLFIVTACFLTGSFIAQLHNVHQQFIPQKSTANQQYSFSIETQEEVILTANSTKVKAKIVSHPLDSLVNKSLIVYGLSDTLKRNTLVAVKSYINPISSPQNPQEFNYQTYMATLGIYYQAFVSDKQYAIGPKIHTKVSFIRQLQNHCERILQKQLEQEHIGIGKALLLGQREDLSLQTKATFTRSGTMHILAVSGLHVGIIYLLFNQILWFFFKQFKLPKWAIPILLILIIWTFACLTGAKASVIRAAVMFTLFALGRHFMAHSHSLNILAATAFFMLIVKPNFLYDVGFQLSFTAVAGILLIFPLLRNLWPGGNKVVRYLKDIVFVSFAAQLATLPLTLFYFHQTPTLGLISNIVAIPVAFTIVASGFLSFLLFWVPGLKHILGTILETAIQVLNSTNTFISSHSFSTISNIEWSIPQVLFAYSALLALVGFFSLRWKPTVYVFLISVLGFVTTSSSNVMVALQQNEITIYSLQKVSVVEFVSKRESVLFYSGNISDTQMEYSIIPNQRKLKLQTIRLVNIDSVSTFENAFLRYEKPFVQFKNEIVQVSGDVPSPEATMFLINQPNNKWLKESTKYSNKIFVANRYPSTYIPTKENIYYLKHSGAYTKKVTSE